MKRLFLVALPAGLAILAATLLLGTLRARGDAAGAAAERARLKREFVERAGVARALPAEELAGWRSEVTALVRGHLEALATIKNRFPQAPRAPQALEAAQEDRKGPLPDKDRAAIQDFQKYADGRFALLRDGGYAPLASSVAGGLRLDLLAAEAGPSPGGGGPGLRIDFALWGAPRLVERERTGDRTASRTVVPVVLEKLGFQFVDAAGKAWGEMNGPGEPYQKLQDPERFVEDFPPGVLFGTWWVELLPREAVRADVTLQASVRLASGSSRPVAFALSLPVPEGWKVPPGTTYQAERREVTPEPAKR